MDFNFFLTTALLGVGLAMDAFSVSLTNGFKEPEMTKKRAWTIASIFGLFQGVMPFIGWVLAHLIVTGFSLFQNFIPFISLALLWGIGIRMIVNYVKKRKENTETVYETQENLAIKTILLQAIATSIDALSAGLTIANYSIWYAIVSFLIIGLITTGLCYIAIKLGKKFGTGFTKHTELIGGIILILIGTEIFITGMISLYT